MQLTGKQVRQLQEALLTAFPQRSDLTRVVRFGLDQYLDNITTAGTYSQVVFELIEWAEAHNQITALLEAACAENPASRTLQTVRTLLQKPGESPQLEEPTGNLPVQHKIPAAPSGFVPRPHEEAAVRALLERPDVRLVTLTGTGGTGKTRLAIQIAHGLESAFFEGVYFVALASVRTAEAILNAILQILELGAGDEQTAAAMIQAYLREKRVLLVLDNLEQIVEPAAVIGARILAAAPDVKVLVTSRIALGIRGEYEYPIPPLQLPDRHPPPTPEQLGQYEAARLFIERAQASKPDFAATKENAPAIAEICHRLDGLPLAIELAAARIRILPPLVMLGRLEHRLGLLTGGARDVPLHQQTLRGTIDWSYELLTPSEQRLFQRLAVFVEGAFLEAIAAIATPAELGLDTADGVESLVRKSLVRQWDTPEESRFGLLETIREYAQERLTASGEERLLRERHAAFFLEHATQHVPALRGSKPQEIAHRLDYEQANFAAALAWWLGDGHNTGRALQLAAILAQFWYIQRHWTEGRQWLGESLRQATSAPANLRAQGLLGAGILARRDGDYPAAIGFLGEALDYARAVTDLGLITEILFNLGSIAQKQGQYVQAQELQEEALAGYQKQQNVVGIAYVMDSLGKIAREQGNLAPARMLLEESLAMRRAKGNRRQIAYSLNGLAEVVADQGDYAAARELLQESLQLQYAVNNLYGVGAALNSLGQVAWAEGDSTTAGRYWRESLTLQREMGDKGGMLTSIEGLAVLAAQVGQPERAVRLFAAAALQRQVLGMARPPVDKPAYEAAVGGTRKVLKAAQWTAAWNEGLRWTLDEAGKEALQISIK